MALPGVISYCKITGLFLEATADTSGDPDDLPQGNPLVGATVTFRAAPSAIRTSSPAATTIPREFVCSTDASGYLYSPGVTVDGDGNAPSDKRFLYILASDDPDIEPHNWSWYFKVYRDDLPSISGSFIATADGEIDLATVVQVPASPGAETAAWIQAVTAATDARDAAVDAQQAAESARDALLGAADVAATGDSLAKRTPTGTLVVAPAVTSGEAVTLGQAQGLPGTGAQRLVSAAAVGTASLVVAAAGDSTIDMADEWLARGLQMWCAEHGRAASAFYSYGDSGPYQTATLIPEWTDYYRDEFARSGDVYGSTPDMGVAYTGSAGGWTCDGARAVSTGTNAWVYQTAGSAAPGGRRRVALDIDIDTTGAATDKILTLYIGTDINNGVDIELKITASTGAQVWSLGKKVAGVQTWLATGAGSPLTVGATSSTVSLEINAAGLITGTIGASTVVGQLSASETSAIIPGAYMVWYRTYGTSAASAISLRRAYAQTGTPSGSLTLYNGSRAATTLTYAGDRIANLYPSSVAIDLLVVSSSHNYTTTPVADWLAALDAFITAFRSIHPESGILITSQNPEYSPIVLANIQAHQARNAAARKYAAQRGYGYLPIAEAWAARSNVTDWIQSDGVHPTRATEVADPANASYGIGTMLRDYLDGLAVSPAQSTRQIIAGTGLTGGGDLSADRTLAVQFGSTAGKAVEGNDPRVSGGLLAVGEETFHRMWCNGSATATNSTLRVTFFTARTATVVSSVRITTGNTAAGATPTLIRIGLYSVASNGDLTLVGSTASDASLFAAGNTQYTKALSATVTLTPGQRYAVGVLVVTSATAPTIVGNTLAGGMEMGAAPRLSGVVNSRTDLPASVTAASVANSPNAMYVALIPA